MKFIVVYTSVSGFTEKYAKWISASLSSECYPMNRFDRSIVDRDTIVIYGGSLHAIGINGWKKFKNKIGANCKEIVVFAVGASPIKNGIENELKEANFKTEKERKIRLFYLRGGFDYSKLRLKEKILMALLKMKIKLKNASERTGDEKGMLASYDKPLDATRYENINELVEYVRSIK